MAEWEADQGHVATAFLHHSASLVARIGRLLGHEHEAERFERPRGARRGRVANRVRRRRRTLDAGHAGQPRPRAGVRTGRRRARDRTAARLVELIRQAGTHLGTGFLATPYLLPVLADTGHLDVAYELLLQDTPPSWLTMVVRGATTVWEDWDGIGEDGTPKASLEPLQQGRGHRVPAPVRRGCAAPRRPSGVRALPDRAAAGRRPDLGGSGARLAVRAHRIVVAHRRRTRSASPSSSRPARRRRCSCPTAQNESRRRGSRPYECSLSAPGAAE